MASPTTATRSTSDRTGIRPRASVGVRIGGKGVTPHLNAVTRIHRGDVSASLDGDRVYEVLVQVVDVLADTVVEGTADGDVVEQRQVLDVFAHADSAGMRAHRHPELGGQQQDGDHLVDTAQPAAVDLAEVDRSRLHELLEHHAVVDVLAGGHADGRDRVTYAAVAEHIVWTGGLFDPPRIHLGERPDRGDGLLDSPNLVRVEHQPALRPDRLANDARPAQV